MVGCGYTGLLEHDGSHPGAGPLPFCSHFATNYQPLTNYPTWPIPYVPLLAPQMNEQDEGASKWLDATFNCDEVLTQPVDQMEIRFCHSLHSPKSHRLQPLMLPHVRTERVSE